jgi:DNA-binding NarL/FixJ family response regulator
VKGSFGARLPAHNPNKPRYKKRREGGDMFSELTETEWATVRLNATGADLSEMASILGCSLRALKQRMHRIYNKVGCESRLQLAVQYVHWAKENLKK